MRIRRIIIRPAAEREIEAIAITIARDRLDAALRFYDAFTETSEFLRRIPGAGTKLNSRLPSLAGLRSSPMNHFRNYLVFFLPRGDAVEILHVVHGARQREISRLLKLRRNR